MTTTSCRGSIKCTIRQRTTKRRKKEHATWFNADKQTANQDGREDGREQEQRGHSQDVKRQTRFQAECWSDWLLRYACHILRDARKVTNTSQLKSNTSKIKRQYYHYRCCATVQQKQCHRIRNSQDNVITISTAETNSTVFCMPDDAGSDPRCLYLA